MSTNHTFMKRTLPTASVITIDTVVPASVQLNVLEK